MDKDTGGLLNFSKAYHFIKQEVNEAVDAIRIAFKIPSAKVISSVNPADNQQKISTFTEDSQMNNMKPSSMHFISSPVINEMVPVFAYDSSRFYGPPLPIYDSITNSAQLVPTATSEYKPDFGVSPIQITPGDVAVQGRYGHAIVLSDKESRPTIRIGNGFRSRDASDVEVFNADEFSSELNSAQNSNASIPNFFDPNVDGSSIYLLKNSSPGIDLKTEAKLNGTERIVDYEKKVLSSPVGATFAQNKSVNDKMLLSSNSIFIYTKGANYNNHNISVLSSGHLSLNSMKNIFITTPAVDEDEKSGFIYIGTSENRGLLPNSPMQPAVRGLNYLNTMVGISKASDTEGAKLGDGSVLGILKNLTDALDNLANGGIAVDGNGVSKSDISAISKPIKDRIKSLHNKILGTQIEADGISVWTGDVSKKVFVE